eukprot:2314739-Amphidinium_carterae.1
MAALADGTKLQTWFVLHICCLLASIHLHLLSVRETQHHLVLLGIGSNRCIMTQNMQKHWLDVGFVGAFRKVDTLTESSRKRARLCTEMVCQEMRGSLRFQSMLTSCAPATPRGQQSSRKLNAVLSASSELQM